MKNTKYESAPSHVFTSFPETHNDPNENEDMQKVRIIWLILIFYDLFFMFSFKLLVQDQDEFSDQNENKQYSYTNIEFYQKYFNVNTNDVIYR